uniref:Uncharacterized protein n=1 Tax=uncultured gamma proteobacterium HF0010_16J05 TaxID=710981 RepID=E0XR30_9GAMM|nr:hypothetical protein [uncultured gamma proteobacterium HF0010_16J05]
MKQPKLLLLTAVRPFCGESLSLQVFSRLKFLETTLSLNEHKPHSLIPSTALSSPPSA